MEIVAIRDGSTASRSPLRVGDRILKVNGQPVSDFLDLYFHLSEEFVDLEVERLGEGARQVIEVPLTRRYGEEFGLEFPEARFRICGNKCPFCFVDQNPPGMRQAVYVRDDDYRFSFLDGHFITLTNLKESDFQRVIDYHLSPLYVSVHALDPEVRTYLLGTKRASRIRPQIERLIAHDIILHTQIVCLPGVNDGRVLDDTVFGLLEYWPKVRSIGVVPVGLTAHMPAERGLRPYSREEAREVCQHVDRLTARFRREIGCGFIYLADEFLLLAERPIPNTDYYDGFVQLGNGVGMLRELKNDFRRRKVDFERLHRDGRRQILVLSGESAGPVVARMLMRKVPDWEGVTVRTVAVRNDTFGRPTTVTGLLGGRDFERELRAHEGFDLALVPPNAVNDKGLFIDDVSFDALNREFGGRLALGFEPLWTVPAAQPEPVA